MTQIFFMLFISTVFRSCENQNKNVKNLFHRLLNNFIRHLGYRYIQDAVKIYDYLGLIYF